MRQKTNVITKRDRSLLQSASGITKCDRLLLQNVLGITKCDRLLLQSASGITKCDSYCKVRRNTGNYLYLFEISPFPYRNNPFSTCVKISRKLVFLTSYSLIRRCTFAFQGIRNVSFSVF